MGPDPGTTTNASRLVAATGVAARISRRQLMQRSAVAVGGIAGLGLIDPSVVFGSTFAPPAPIPGGLDATFTPVPKDPFIHVLAPSVPFEMSSITDFNGVIGASETQGSAVGSDGSSYDFDCDMRFMRGVYVGLDGRRHNASFGFIWIDLFDVGHVGDPFFQSHDFEPGIAPSGLFWTIPITPSAIDVDPGSGRARLHANNVAVTDYHDFFNSVSGGGPTPIPSHVSFDVRWSGDGDREKVRNDEFGFTGHYVTGTTTISFSAFHDDGGVIYSSEPNSRQTPQINVGSPGVGHERNGVFFQ